MNNTVIMRMEKPTKKSKNKDHQEERQLLRRVDISKLKNILRDMEKVRNIEETKDQNDITNKSKTNKKNKK